jgi:multidrug efflux pump subunit AcrA (membrane-fusion protein)
VARAKSEQAAAQADAEAATGDMDRAQGMADAAQKAVIQAQKEVKSAQADLDYWRAEIAREESLLKAGAVSVEEYQSEKAQAIAAEAELETRQAKVTEAQANVRAAEGDVRSKQAAVRAARERVAAAKASVQGAGRQVGQKVEMARQAGAAAATASVVNEYRYVRAPFAGTVTKRYLSPGQFAGTGTAILSVVQIDQVRLQANVADKDLPLVQVGATVTARFAKYPNLTISATVTSVSPIANQNSKTALVEAIVPNPGHRFVPGDGVTLSIATSRSTRSITVPVNAIVQKDGMSAVWVVRIGDAGSMPDMPGMQHDQGPATSPKNGKKTKQAHLVMVTTGATDGRRTEILAGLSSGDEVIYEGNTYLREGDVVTPMKWGAGGPAGIPEAPAMEPDMPGMKH